MTLVEAEYLSLLASHVDSQSPKVPFVSSATTTIISKAGKLNASY